MNRAPILFVDDSNFGSAVSGLEPKPAFPRNRISSVEQYLVSFSGSNEKFLSSEALDSPADFDDGRTDSIDGKTNSIDGILDDKDDLESLVNDVRPELPGKLRSHFLLKY